jgi:hypothetical protein
MTKGIDGLLMALCEELHGYRTACERNHDSARRAYEKGVTEALSWLVQAHLEGDERWGPRRSIDGLDAASMLLNTKGSLEMRGCLRGLGDGRGNPAEPFEAHIAIEETKLAYTLSFGSAAHGIGGFPWGKREELEWPRREDEWLFVFRSRSDWPVPVPISAALLYRVTRYDPALRDARGAYIPVTWTAFGDIGRRFEGAVLTEDEYMCAEDAHVSAATSFMEEAGVERLTMVDVENHAGYEEPGVTIAACIVIAAGLGTTALACDVAVATSWRQIVQVVVPEDLGVGMVHACAHALLLGAIAVVASPRLASVRCARPSCGRWSSDRAAARARTVLP